MYDKPASDASHHYSVHTGIWINWSYGSVYGATLTLRREDANLLIAFVAVFVSVIGNRLWRICCFTFHQFYTSRDARGGLYHQRQAILRNSSTATSGFLTLIKLPWAWRNTARRPFRQVLPLLIFTALFATTLTLASGFSSKVVTGTEALLSGDKCAWLDIAALEHIDDIAAMGAFTVKSIQLAASYAQQCYSSDSSGPLTCNVFVKPMLPTTVLNNATCPFQSTICRKTDANILLDTGYLDSHTDFGLNAPPSQRFQYRRVLHCAPIRTEGHKTIWNASSDRSYTTYNYGATSLSDFDYTYPNDVTWDRPIVELGAYPVDYAIGFQEVTYSNGSVYGVDSELIPALRRPDADVSILYLSASGILYVQKTADDWYKATTERIIPDDYVPSGYHFYSQDEPASPLACAAQEQFCNPNLPQGSRCTPLTGRFNASINARKLAIGNESANRMVWLAKTAFLPLSVDRVASMLGSQALLSKQNFAGGIQNPLPDNQWQLEVQNWFAILLAVLQGRFINTVTGNTDTRISRLMKGPTNIEERTMCSSQKILSSNYTSFSIFALLIIFVFGIFVVVVSFILNPAALLIRKYYGLDYGPSLEWCSNQTLQLQRLAHEGVGAGTWSCAVNTVPVTKFGQRLATLDLTDKDHPTLLPPEQPLLQIQRRTRVEDLEANETDVDDKSMFGHQRSSSLEHLIKIVSTKSGLGHGRHLVARKMPPVAMENHM